MPQFDFPASPVVDQKFEQNGLTFIWTGKVWNYVPPDVRTEIEIQLDRKVSVAGDNMIGWLGLPYGDPQMGHHAVPKHYVDRLTGGIVYTTDEPPTNVQPGTLWWESDTGFLYIYYDDGDSRQWVQTVGGTGSVTVGGAAILDDPPTINLFPGMLWWDSNKGALYLYYDDGDTQQWVQVDGGGGAGGGIEEAPTDGAMYARQMAGWVTTTTTLMDAPVDGKPYVRKDGAWLWADPPLDGTAYSRQDGTWVPAAAASGDFLPLTGGTLTGNITFSGANLSVIFSGGSKIYAHSDKALRICAGDNGSQPQIANAAGADTRDIIDTRNGDARYLRPTGGTMTGNLTFGSDINLVMSDSTSNIRGIGGNGIHYLVSGNDNHCHGFFASGVLKMHVWNQGVTIYGTFTDALEADIPGSKDEKGGTDIGKTLALMAAKIKALEDKIDQLTAAPKKGK